MEDSEQTLAKAGIQDSGNQPRLKRVRGFVCEVCYDEGAQETLALSCDHRCESGGPGETERKEERAQKLMRFIVVLLYPVCKDCYAHYVSSKINDGESRRIQCMGNKCNVIVDEKTVELLVSHDVLVRSVLLLSSSCLRLIQPPPDSLILPHQTATALS
jgi:ariadne-1